MSRTKKGKKSIGYDFGARLNCDKGYNARTGKVPKDRANSERREAGKKDVKDGIEIQQKEKHQ